MKKCIKFVLPCLMVVLVIVGVILLYRYNYIPHKRFSAEDFGIETYTSSVDYDQDGIDDQTDILNGVRAYLDTKPKYKSKYYNSGFPDDEYGVCTDVVINGLLEAGYNLRELMDEDIKLHKKDYNIDSPDNKIDFRRVVNMEVYLRKYAISLTTDINEINEWQPGDIVVWKHHVGILSDTRNSKGMPFVLHNASPFQASYEEDVLRTWGKIIGHYRIS